MIRLELVEFSADHILKAGFKCKRIMIAFKGLETATAFPKTLQGGVSLTYDASFVRRMGLALSDNKGGTYYLTGQTIDDQGKPVLLYEQNIKVSANELQNTFKPE